jgi:vacuolar protein sorting-associated protein IST1
MDVPKFSSYLRQSISRINIHRGKKLNSIAKKKDDIAKHLEAGNEVNAKIWAETLINEEGMIPCFDIISILCDQLNGRLKTIEKFGPPKDMDQNFRTLIYAAPRMEIDELLQVRHQLEKILGKEFVLAADTDEEALNKVVAANINIRIPEEGEKVKRLIEIARERNIDYKPSSEAIAALRDYCDRKGMENPLGGSTSHHVVVDNMIPPPYNPNMGFEVNYQMPPPPQNYGGGMPAY